MITRRALLVGAACLGALMLSDIARAERRQLEEIERRSDATYVDMGVELRVVVRDEIDGAPMVPGNSEPVRVIATHRAGGIVKVYTDTQGNRTARIVAPSKNPVIWYASEAQADLILHDGDVPWVLVNGSEGSGKTSLLCLWVFWRSLAHIGHEREIGITAPTFARLAHVKREIKRWWRPSWYRFSERNQKYTFTAGPSVQLVSATQRSEEAGSPIQGANWVAAAADEFQDHFSRDADIIARGRSAPRGWYPRLNTSTFKDSPDWRTFRAQCETNSVDWHTALLLGLESPFIPPSHWERFKRGVTLREYQPRVLAMDVGPERQLYYAWRRSIVANDNTKQPGNLRTLPLGAVDVTARELSGSGVRNASLLLGHDPGRRQHVTEILKAYEFPEQRVAPDGRRLPPLVRWFVVDEITTPECTIETHVTRVLERVRSKWRCQLNDPYTGRLSPNSPVALVRIDPHTPTGDEHPDRVVYAQWRNAGFHTMAAAYHPQTQRPTPIKVEARVDLLNTLLCNTDGERRLFVLILESGEPAAPKLVAAFETMERDERGAAEWEAKDENDLSHWPASVAFCTWAIEKPRVDALRMRAA